jgi:tungstate transport system substrate-binding protein
VKRYPVMYNDFVLIGPKSDPAGIKGTKDVAKALSGRAVLQQMSAYDPKRTSARLLRRLEGQWTVI